MLKSFIFKAHRLAKTGYAASEHCAAVAYASCEFFNAHQLILATAVALIGLGVVLIIAVMVEKAL